MFDSDGKRYYDALSSLWYCNIGHGRSEVAEAIASQLGRLDTFHTFDLFVNEPCVALSERLAELAPMPGARVFLTSSGSEAVDSAVKLARQAHTQAGDPERTIIVSRTPSYHGVTYGGMSLTGMDSVRTGFGPLVEDVRRVPHDDLRAMEDAFADLGNRVAAVIAEPMIAGGGVYPAAPGYLQGLRRICNAHGAFLICDEVVCGFGRLGAWWGSAHYGVRPDIVTFAKAVTSGYQPLGGVLLGPSVREPLEANPEYLLAHGHTYSGHPTACAAALTAIEITAREDLPSKAPAIGTWLEDELEALVRDGLVASTRGLGALRGAVLPEGISGDRVHRALVGRGVITRVIRDSIVAFAPPLITTRDDIAQCVDALRGAIKAVRTDRLVGTHRGTR